MGAHVCDTVASNAISLPREYKNIVSPFGSFQSPTSNPNDLRVDATPQDANAFRIRECLSPCGELFDPRDVSRSDSRVQSRKYGSPLKKSNDSFENKSRIVRHLIAWFTFPLSRTKRVGEFPLFG